MARKKDDTKKKSPTTLPLTPELDEVSRQLATLALAQLEQDGEFSVRQGEQLRRALAIAGDELAWNTATALGVDVVAEATKDVMKMAKAGAKALGVDLADALVRKRVEIVELEKAGVAARALAADPDTAYPTEVVYSYTVRDVIQNLVTKTETLTVNDATETDKAADAIEKNSAGRTKLTDLMILDIQKKQAELEVMKKVLPDFLKSLQTTLREVIANLH